jgi:hypothetical protein
MALFPRGASCVSFDFEPHAMVRPFFLRFDARNLVDPLRDQAMTQQFAMSLSTIMRHCGAINAARPVDKS